MIGEIFEIIRPKQWYKNLVVFAAIFFSKNIFNMDMLEASILAFISLCLVSSATYIVNDIIDANADRHHDKKKSRPIASGKMTVPVAIFLSFILYAVGFAISFYVGSLIFISTAVLAILSQTYNLWIKNIAFADITLLSTNFMIRAVIGGFAIGVTVSSWLILGAYLIALFLSAAKRKSDMAILGETAKSYKKVFEIYTKTMLEQIIMIAATLLLMSYCLYIFLGSKSGMLEAIATIPVVFFMVFRYYYLTTLNSDAARSAELVFKDKQMLAGMLLWFIIFFIGLYY